jgi:hypothetical protein
MALEENPSAFAEYQRKCAVFLETTQKNGLYTLTIPPVHKYWGRCPLSRSAVITTRGVLLAEQFPVDVQWRLSVSKQRFCR